MREMKDGLVFLNVVKMKTEAVVKAIGVFLAMNAAILVGRFLSRWMAYRHAPKGFIFAYEVFALFFAILY